MPELALHPPHTLSRIALSCLAALSWSTAQAADVTITADRLLDVRTGRMVQNPEILVRDGRIVSVKPVAGTPAAGTPAAPADGGARIALPGMTLVPGLIDMHVHLDSDPTYGGYSYLEYNDRFWSALAVAHAARTLDAGFTTVRNVGASDWNDVGLGQAIAAGKVRGPRIVAGAWSFGPTGSHCDSTYFPPSMDEKNPYNADGPEEVRKSVRALRKYGAQVIKVCATGGVFSRNTEPGQQQMNYAELRAAVEEAAQWGLKVAAHAHGAAGIKDAIRAGITTVEHASLIDDEGIALAKKHGTWLSMDIYNGDYTALEGKKNGVLEDNLRKDREITETQRQNFRKAHAAGVKMVYGTDAGVHPHGGNGKQFAVMVKYGMTPLQAIQAATINSAEALGSKDVGIVEPGRYADMVAVPGDPTVDVRLLEAPAVVIKGGEVVKRGAP